MTLLMCQELQALSTGPADTGTSKNPTDDALAVMNSVQDNDYVQSCVLNKGKSPIVIYLAKQVQDMRRF